MLLYILYFLLMLYHMFGEIKLYIYIYIYSFNKLIIMVSTLSDCPLYIFR